ncbi:MAG: hypothetical protein KC912_19570 [Proteobacteria bacterium]|nr:hypothetical protein [Pseudomonadota bacterium]
MSALRSLPDAVHRAYLMPISAFAIALMVLWAVSLTPVALTLLYALFLYNAALTVWWSQGLFRRQDAEELRASEVTSGVLSVVRLLGWSSVLPGVLFAATDPLSTEVWKTSGSIAIVTTLALVLAPWLAKRGHRVTYVASLLIALVALPLNTSGALSMAFWLGWVETLTQLT